MKYGKDLFFPKGWRGRAGEPGFPAKKYIWSIIISIYTDKIPQGDV